MAVRGLLVKELQNIKKQPVRILLYLSVIAALGLNIWFFQIHELYRDEAQSWLIVKNTGPLSLFKILPWEGHPFLYYYLLMPFAKLGFPYETVKVISTVLMAMVILITAYFSPFSILFRIAFVLSGFCLYRYASFGRSYALFALLVILICVFYKKRHERPVPYFLVVSLLLQTHILAVGFAFGLCVVYLAEELMQIKQSGFSAGKLLRRLWPLLLPLFSAVFLLFELSDFRNAQVFTTQRLHYENMKFSLSVKDTVTVLLGKYAGLFTVLFILHVFFVLIRYRRYLKLLFVLFAGWTACILIFTMSVNMVNHRALTIAYMFLWYLWCLKESESREKNGRILPISRAALPGLLFRILNIVMTAVLILGIDNTVYDTPSHTGLKYDLTHSYSDSKNAAAALAALPADAVILEGTEDYCNAVIAWLPQYRVINPFLDEPAVYVKRNRKLQHTMNNEEFMEYCRNRFPEKDEVFLLNAIGKCKIMGFSEEGMEVFYKSPNTVHTGDIYVIYRIPLN